MNREQLLEMPISQLRGLDIKEKEDELLVQEVLNEKLESEPNLDPNRPVLSSSETDNLTPEKERALQARLDAEDEEVSAEPEVITEVIEPETPVVKKRFCQFCDSKAVRHKKECTRLSTNITQIV
jgi:hypothetical protein